MRLQDAHVLITGGTDGVGLALALALQAQGARVTVCGRSAARLACAKAALAPAGGAVIACDIGHRLELERLLEQANKAHGPIDVLINNAAIQRQMDLTSGAQAAHIEEEVRINLLAPMLLSAWALPELLTRDEAMLIQINSGLGRSPKAASPIYCATKAGLHSLSTTLGWQLEGSRVRHLEVFLPLVDTQMTKGRGKGKLRPEDVAARIVAAMARGAQGELYIGKTRLLRLLLRLSPALTARLTRSM